MGADTIQKIEEQVKQVDSLAPEKKDELLNLLEELRAEVEGLSEKDAEKVKSIAHFTQASAHEATRMDKDEALFNHALQGLEASVKDFEVTHPKITDVVNSICMMLSNIGI